MSSPAGNYMPSASTASKRLEMRSRVSYPRKRALTACEACRQRKTRCDNQRPTCGGCAELQIYCSFQAPTSHRSTYDRASLEILERIDYVAGLLESQRNKPQAAPATSLSPQPPAPYARSTASPSSAVHDASSQQPWAETLLESLQINGRSPGVCEDILEWAVFGSAFDRSRIERLIFDPFAAAERSSQSPSLPHRASTSTSTSTSTSRGLNEEHAPSLVEKFLVNVHIKNPVLDPDDLRRRARHISEAGFGWDADSCLLLIVCGLATLSSDFHPNPVVPDLVDGPNATTSLLDAGDDYPTAEAYYTAARKRLGLLDYTIAAAQCCFLTGVYEMYALRPVSAWGSFKRACDTLQIYFRSQRAPNLSGSDGLVSRLYWSCLKSECEIRMEINLPSSGIAHVADQDVFPTPPAESPGHRHGDDDGQTDKPFPGLEHPEFERIWSYYLSEIAIRKIGNRIMNCFYRDDATAWLAMPLGRMVRIAEELEIQLTQWYDNLPVILFTPSADDDRAPQHSDARSRIAHELQFMLQARLADFRERIYRPFLYLAVHLPPADPAQSCLAPLVQRCIAACEAFLRRGTPRHRHHGTWYENRGMFLKSLLLVAVAKSGRVPLPASWRHGTDLCLAGFQFWAGEAPDLAEASAILRSLLEQL